MERRAHVRSAVEAELASRGRKPREAKSLAKPFGLVLSRIAGGARDALKRRGPSPRVSPWRELPGLKSLSRLGEPLQAESLVLSENLPENLVGLGRPARGTLVSTVPTVAPGPAMGTPKAVDAGEASRGQRCLTGPRHVERCGCARGHDLLGFNGQPGGARHVRGNWSIKPGAQTAPVTSPITPPHTSPHASNLSRAL